MSKAHKYDSLRLGGLEGFKILAQDSKFADIALSKDHRVSIRNDVDWEDVYCPPSHDYMKSQKTFGVFYIPAKNPVDSKNYYTKDMRRKLHIGAYTSKTKKEIKTARLRYDQNGSVIFTRERYRFDEKNVFSLGEDVNALALYSDGSKNGTIRRATIDKITENGLVIVRVDDKKYLAYQLWKLDENSLQYDDEDSVRSKMEDVINNESSIGESTQSTDDEESVRSRMRPGEFLATGMPVSRQSKDLFDSLVALLANSRDGQDIGNSSHSEEVPQNRRRRLRELIRARNSETRR